MLPPVPWIYIILISFIFTFQRRSRSLLDNDELKKLYSVLEANSTTPEDEFSSICEDNLMDYESFLKAKSLSSSKCQQYFKPMIFAKLQHGDPHGRISVMAFFNYVMRKVDIFCPFIWTHQHRKKYPFLYVCIFFSK